MPKEPLLIKAKALTSPARSRSPRSACASAIAPSTSTGDSSAMSVDSARQRSSATSDARRSPRYEAGSLPSLMVFIITVMATVDAYQKGKQI